jgi:hypothetical protein
VKRLDYSEPAVLRGILTALLALAASLGLVIPADLTAAAEGLIPAVAFLLPLVQAWWTRQSVYSPATHNEQLGKAAAGLSDGPA